MYYKRQNDENSVSARQKAKIPSTLAHINKMAPNRDIRRFTMNSVVLSPKAALNGEKSDSYSPVGESDRVGQGPTFVQKKGGLTSKGATPTVGA